MDHRCDRGERYSLDSIGIVSARLVVNPLSGIWFVLNIASVFSSVKKVYQITVRMSWLNTEAILLSDIEIER